jgi:hypothetical protein
MIQNDSLYTSSQQEVFSLDTISESLPRFFVEKGKTQIIENKRIETDSVPLWIDLSLIFWVFVIVFARLSYTFRMRQIITTTINPKQVKYLLREGNLLKQGFPVILLLLYFFTISLFAFIAINQYLPESFYFSVGEGFLILYGVVVLFHLLKFVSIWFLGFMFNTRKVSLRYLLDHYLFHISEGFILFPLLILFVYSDLQLFMYAAIIVLLLLWLYRLQRAIVIGLACANFSPSYLFLYLCTLEVMPFFLIYKLGLQFA